MADDETPEETPVKREPTIGKIDLPSGGWAKFRDPDTITEAMLRPVRLARSRMLTDQAFLGVFRGEDSVELADDRLAQAWDYTDALTALAVEEWSHEHPVTAEGLRAIPSRKDYTALVLAAAAHQDELFPSFDVTPDPESPTAPSEG